MHINHFSDLGTNSEPTTRHFAPTQTFSSTQRYCNLHRHFNLQQTFRPSTDISSCHRHFHLSKDIATSTDISICNRHFAPPQTFHPATDISTYPKILQPTQTFQSATDISPHHRHFDLPQALHSVSSFPVAGLSFCRGLGMCRLRLLLDPPLDRRGLHTYGDWHRSQLKGWPACRIKPKTSFKNKIQIIKPHAY